MTSMQIDFLDPKVKKVVLGLQAMGLVKLSPSPKATIINNELTDEFVDRLDQEYELYKSGKGKYFSMDEVFEKYFKK